MPASPVYYCIHGHFYQPPRENPWLGVVEEQASAAPFHDWNDRITAECYSPNTRARVLDDSGRVARLVNNFRHMSFNIGPTLFSWLAENHPECASRVVDADRESAARLNGHGNAIAQAYNHSILPLCNERDKRTQIAWGLEEFRFRFGRQAEGIWLPETAINMATISALIDLGVKFVVLSPKQAARIRPFGESVWKECIGRPFDTRRPYRVFERDSQGRKHCHRCLDVFFYNGELSGAVAFGHLLRDAAAMHSTFASAVDKGADGPQLVAAATDGESYGHHERFGEMCIAAFYGSLERQGGGIPTNFAHYLSLHPPAWEAEVWEGEKGEGSSWSCCHGVGRWKEDCGCRTGGPDWWKQGWRGPLRAAFDELNEVCINVFATEGRAIFHDPWEARDRYIDVVLDQSCESRQRFLAAHAPAALNDAKLAAKAWKLLEMQRLAMCMYTSCGWFFSDSAGLEAVQNMRYALRAAQYAQEFSDWALEARLLAALEKTPSNDPEIGTAGGAFRHWVKPRVHPEDTVAASFAMTSLMGLPHPKLAFKAEQGFSREARSDNLAVISGTLILKNPWLATSEPYAFLAAQEPGREVSCLLRHCPSQEDSFRFLSEVQNKSTAYLSARLKDEGVWLRHLPLEVRAILLRHIMGSTLEELSRLFADTYSAMWPLLKLMRDSNLEPPVALRAAAESVLTSRFTKQCRAIARDVNWTGEAAAHARAIDEESRGFGLHIDKAKAAEEFGEVAVQLLGTAAANLDPASMGKLRDFALFAVALGIPLGDVALMQARYWDASRRSLRHLASIRKAAGGKPENDEGKRAGEFCASLREAGLALGFGDRHLDAALAESSAP